MNTLSKTWSQDPLRRELTLVGPMLLGFFALLLTVLLWAPSPIDREFTTVVQALPAGAFGRLARLGSRLLGRKGRIRRLPPPLHLWTKGRDFPTLPEKSFTELWEEREGERD